MQDLINALKERKVILFVGSGISSHLGLPTFKGLIDYLAMDLGYEPELFKLFGDYLSLSEFYRIQKGTIGPLRSWLDKHWNVGKDIKESPVHKLITELKCPIIYTTNYDNWIEKAHEAYGIPYKKIVNVGDMPRIKDDEIQIVKFHGDFTDDDSIVLTESSYFDRLNFESPLDVKLTYDALGKSILFLGYSLTDINIRYLLYKIHRQWEASAYSRVRPKSYIFLARPNPVQEAILEERGVKAFVSDKDDSTKGIIEFLGKLLKEAFSIT